MIAMLLIPVALRVGCGLLAKRQETLLAADVAASNKRGWAAVEAHLAAIKSGGYQAWVANTPDIRGTGAMCVGNRPDALMLGRWVTETLPDGTELSLSASHVQALTECLSRPGAANRLDIEPVPALVADAVHLASLARQHGIQV